MKAIKGFSRLVVAAVGATILAFALRGEAATVTVFVGNTNLIGTAADVFVPPVTNVFLGDQVVWVWEGSFHSSTSGTSTSTNATPNGLWDAGVNSQPHSFTNTFNSPGSYTYYCSVHFSLGMTGAVNVASVPAPKTVTVFVGNTNLIGTAADVFVPPSTNINVNDSVVWDWEGSFHSTTSGTSTSTNATPNGLWDSGVNSRPHLFTNTFSSAGSFTYYCSVHFSLGMTGVVNVGTAPPIVLSAPQFFLPTHFRFEYTANTNQSYIVQRSADLTSSNWTTLGTNQPTSSPVIFDDTNATSSQAFYRVGQLPGP